MRVFLAPLLAAVAFAQVPSGMSGKEAALGAGLREEILKRASPILESVVQEYVDRVGSQLAAHTDRPELTWTFTVIREDAGGSTREAMALPGGAMVIPASLILSSRDQSEFAGMLAHSMAHVAQRHGSRISFVNSTGVPLVFAGGWTRVGAATDDALSTPLRAIPAWREAELDADRTAVRILSGAGLDAGALLRYIQRTQRDFPRDSRVQSMLPPREERMPALQASVAAFPTASSHPSEALMAVQARLHEIARENALSGPDGPPTLRRRQER